MFWGAVASILGLFLSLWYWLKERRTQRQKNIGIEANEGSNIPKSPKKETNQMPRKVLTLESLEADFSLLNKMNYTSNREAGLMHLIKKALEAENYDLTSKAIEFALALSYSSNRDTALRIIVDKALSQGHKDIAIRATDGFKYSSNADSARQQILKHSSSSATQNLPAKRP